MSLLKAVYKQSKTYSSSYRWIYFFSIKSWYEVSKHRRQRADRGWSYEDSWAGGEHIMEVSMGILNQLHNNGIVDWEYSFKNFIHTHGYGSLAEVAQDLDNYLYWRDNSYSDPLYKLFDQDTRWIIDDQLYSQAIDAMHFVADNIGALWD